MNKNCVIVIEKQLSRDGFGLVFPRKRSIRAHSGTDSRFAVRQRPLVQQLGGVHGRPVANRARAEVLVLGTVEPEAVCSRARGPYASVQVQI